MGAVGDILYSSAEVLSLMSCSVRSDCDSGSTHETSVTWCVVGSVRGKGQGVGGIVTRQGCEWAVYGTSVAIPCTCCTVLVMRTLKIWYEISLFFSFKCEDVIDDPFSP